MDDACGTRLVSVDVTNAGSRRGAEIVQFYVRDRYSSVVTYEKILRGFAKVELGPGETGTVVCEFGPEELQILGKAMKWRVEPGAFDVEIGASSEDIRLRGEIVVDGCGACREG